MAINVDVRLSVEAREASKKRFIVEKNNNINKLERLQQKTNNTHG
jgi:hypothetical protein